MPIRIRILSGSRQDAVLEFDQDKIRIGESPHDEVAFDPLVDPEIVGRRAILQHVGEKWQIHNDGSKPIFVNQDQVTDLVELHQHDLVRLSYDGPDFSVEIFEQPLPNAVVDELEVKRGIGGLMIPLLGGIGLLAVIGLLGLLVIGLFAGRWSETPVAITPPEFQPFGVLKCKEGETLFWRPTLVQNGPVDRYSLSDDAPSRMTIDSTTGTVRWATEEEDGPGDYSCQIMVTREARDREFSDVATIEVRVQEVNRPPTTESMPTQEVNLLESNELRVALRAFDPDIPPQQLTYTLKPQAPEGVSIDPQTGQLSWTLDPNSGNREVAIPYRVTDDGKEPRSVDAMVRVKIVSPDPWSIVEDEIRDSLYLLVVKSNTAQLLLPIGTACAIDDHSLLTSASVASAIDDANQRGWSTLAIDTTNFELSELHGLEIIDARTHSVYVKANSIKEARRRGLQQVYFDLAILSTKEPTKKVCRLGDVESSVKNDQVVACFGYEIFGGSLTRFDDPRPVFSKAKIMEVISPGTGVPSKGRQPLLLQLVGDLSYQPFGGVIVNENAEVLGIYAFSGDLPDDSKAPPVHYAPETVHVQAYLSGQGRDLWIAPTNLQADSKQPK